IPGGFDFGEIGAGLGSEDHVELAGNFVGEIIGGGAGSDLVFVDEALIEKGSLSFAQNSRREIEGSFLGCIGAGNIPDAVEASLGDSILDRAAMRSGAFRDPGFGATDWRASRNVAVIFLNFFAGNFGSHVTSDDHGDVVRAVISLEPLLHVGHGGGVEIGHGTNDGP